jgi:hypothetical protein
MLNCAMAQAVSCWPLTAEAWIHAQVSPCGTGTGFSLSSLFPSPFNITSPLLSILIDHLGDEQ